MIYLHPVGVIPLPPATSSFALVQQDVLAETRLSSHQSPVVYLNLVSSLPQVVPSLTENYGASRDPPEKQAPMCTVHSFPHNIDHCLTWARSEFEGMLEKVRKHTIHNLSCGRLDFDTV